VDKLPTLEDEQKRKCDAAYEAAEETKRQQKSSEEIKKLIKIANKEERKFNLSSRVAELNAQE
ncbi:unnamed protein product, partial [Rotaria magnacalcarata]